MSYEPQTVPCFGCGEPVPYRVGENGSHGEHHTTPLGRCYVRTHRDRECVLAARARHGVTRATVVKDKPNPTARGSLPSPEQVEAAQTGAGGWTREQLRAWGVAWPPPPGWRQRLAEAYAARNPDR